jgi:hypothetical protein
VPKKSCRKADDSGYEGKDMQSRYEKRKRIRKKLRVRWERKRAKYGIRDPEGKG